MPMSSSRSPYKVTHLCNHIQTYQHDCTATSSLARLRAIACPRCLAIKVNAPLSTLVVGTVKGGYFTEDASGRSLAEDDRVTYAMMAGESYLCLPKGYVHSVAIKIDEPGQPTRYKIVYQAAK